MLPGDPAPSALPAPPRPPDGGGLHPVDRRALGLAGACLLAIGALLWRGDRVGLRLVAFGPAAEARDVSAKAAITLDFDAPLAPSAGVSLRLEPPAPGPLLWEGARVGLRPTEPLRAGQRYTVTLSGDLKSLDGRRLRRPVGWSFTVGGPALVFLRRDAAGLAQLWRVEPDGSQVRPLTAEGESGVWDYAVAPDGQRIAYTLVHASGSSSLLSIARDGSDRRLLLECPDAECAGPAWAPDGQTLVFEKRQLPPEGGPVGPPRLWWLRPAGQESVPVLADPQQLGFAARFAPDGRRLAYVSPDEGAIRVLDLDLQSETVIPSEMGEPPAWSPDGTSLVFGRVLEGYGQFAIHLLTALVADAEAPPRDLSAGEGPPVEDGLPAWSPDGRQIAFTRRYTAGPDLNLGRQVWLMQADGSGARRLTLDQTQGYGQPQWSPDGRLLTVQSVSTAGPGAEPALLVLDAADGKLRARVERALLPSWLP